MTGVKFSYFITGPFLLSISAFFVFSFYLLHLLFSVQCGRLRWLPVGFWANENIVCRIVSYRRWGCVKTVNITVWKKL